MKYIVIVLLACTIGLNAANLLKNSGFERSSGNWIKPSYWNGKLEHLDSAEQAYRGTGLMKLTAAQGEKGFSGRAYLYVTEKNLAGRRYLFSVFVKGQGNLYAGTLETYIGNSGDKVQKCNYLKEPFNLANQWQEIQWEINLSRKAPVTIFPFLELRGKDEVFFDEMKLEPVIESKAAMTALTPLQIVPENSQGPAFSFRYSKPDAPVMLFQTAPDRPAEIVEARSDSAGKLCGLVSPVGKSAKEPFPVTAAAEGAAADSWLEIVTQKQFKQFEELAKQIRLSKPLYVLFLGDSLSDFGRGFNYIDKTAFWVNYANPGKMTFRNAGVRGDHIVRMKDRFSNRKTGKKVYRQEEYDDLFGRPYDLIVLFLGQNDTMACASDDFRQPQVTPEKQKCAYQDVLSILREESGAPVVLVSAASLNYDRCRDKAEKALKRGQENVVRFGEPEKSEAFNAALKQLAEENKLDFVDIYTPFRDAPDKAALFQCDGVHLTNQGNTLLAECLLRYLQSKFH